MQNTNNAVVALSDLDQLKAKEKELREKKKALKEAQERQAWETKTKQRNPQFVVGSLRRPTSEDEATLGHVHGWVCSIECASCGKVRVINKQDAFQVRFCSECKTEARKAAAKAKRLEKSLEGKSVEDIQAEIDELNALLTAKSE